MRVVSGIGSGTGLFVWRGIMASAFRVRPEWSRHSFSNLGPEAEYCSFPSGHDSARFPLDSMTGMHENPALDVVTLHPPKGEFKQGQVRYTGPFYVGVVRRSDC